MLDPGLPGPGAVLDSVGLEATRRVPGFHDEPLRGHWAGYRSVRLSVFYQAIYAIRDDGALRPRRDRQQAPVLR